MYYTVLTVMSSVLYTAFQTVLRIWDCLFCEGSKVIHRAALALVLNNKEKIRWCTNFGDVTDVFQKIVVSSDTLQCHTFLKVQVYHRLILPQFSVFELSN